MGGTETNKPVIVIQRLISKYLGLGPTQAALRNQKVRPLCTFLNFKRNYFRARIFGLILNKDAKNVRKSPNVIPIIVIIRNIS